MCGRFVIARASGDLVTLFDVDFLDPDLPGASWNVTPGTEIPIVLESLKPEVAGRHLTTAFWSIIPPWATELKISKYPTFNARVESVNEKATFKSLVATKRGLIPADGYYEWVKDGTKKVPHYIHPRDDRLLAFAALYSWWRDPTGQGDEAWALTATILTRSAVGDLAELHDRSPVFVAPEFWDDWLDPAVDARLGLLDAVVERSPEIATNLTQFTVAPLRGNGPELIVQSPTE